MGAKFQTKGLRVSRPNPLEENAGLHPMADDLELGSDDGSGSGDGKSPQSADPLDFGAIEAAVNEAAKRLNAVWVTFILLMTYFFIATGKITHKDLFLETPVKLPVLGVDVPLLGYFIAAPVFIVAVHFYFLIQLRGLAEKFREYDAVLLDLPEMDRGQAERLRHRIDNSLFAQIFGGPRGAASFFVRLIAVLTAAVLPILLLLFVQLTFLAYQNATLTNIHRALIFFDVVLIMVYFAASDPLLLSARRRHRSEGTRRGWLARLREAFSAARHLGVTILLLLTYTAAAAMSIAVSIFAAVLPSEPRDYSTATHALFEADADPVHQGASSWFSNRLVLPDQNLIEGFDLDKGSHARCAGGISSTPFSTAPICVTWISPAPISASHPYKAQSLRRRNSDAPMARRLAAHSCRKLASILPTCRMRRWAART
jgi:hypothetical protein